jgi:hypothetical protein
VKVSDLINTADRKIEAAIGVRKRERDGERAIPQLFSKETFIPVEYGRILRRIRVIHNFRTTV